MRNILITGLDGSGKSTVFNYLKNLKSSQTAFLHVPYFEIDQLPPHFRFSKLCQGINKMGENADRLQLPLLKIFALFSSMCVYNSIENEFQKLQKEVLLSERHPLIDAPIYALAYRPYMQLDRWELTVFEKIDILFTSEIHQVLGLLKITIDLNSSLSKQLLFYIANVFGKQTPTQTQLKSIFNCKEPDIIYFLDASPQTLMLRLNERKIHEHHEQEAVLEQLRIAYLDMLPQFRQTTIIDAESFESLNAFTVEISSKLY